MEIRERSFLFPKTKGSGPQTTDETITFSRAVRQVAVGIIGYTATFENRNDHHLGRLIVQTSARADPGDPNRVIVSGSFGLRDWSNEWDDDYSGNIQYVLLVELDPVAPPGPGESRGDLVIVDAEITQAIQHFRSAQHLNDPNVFPDNSIRLVADKPTAVRLYVDYDRLSGLAVINTLAGSLEVTAGGTTTTLPPLQTIIPRRDTETDRGLREHTLNFVIPEGSCVAGTVTIRATVRDNFAPTQFSAVFERTLTFEAMPALPILAVGIKYTGPDTVAGATAAELDAPVQADFVGTLALTEKLYPVPAVNITNYLTIEYDKETISDINSGCDKLSDMRNAVADMRGDSDDIVYGLYNTGVDTGSVGGCGRDGAGVGPINSQSTASHEIGHALGRQHAPCDNVSRCATPHNTDGSYPVYSGFDSDSIGEFGFDTTPAQGAVLRPSSAHDIMGYSGNKWISPYTYKALMSRIPERFGGAAGASAFSSALTARRERSEWIKRKTPVLFLRLSVSRDRKVTFGEAFHFLAFPRAHGHARSPFTVELQAEDGTVVRNACLYADDCGCGCGCAGDLWPVKIEQAIPFDARAQKLVIYECDKVIYEQAIPPPPKLKLNVEGAGDPEARDLVLTWEGRDEAGAELCYLVQFFDGIGSWRGCAPRTRNTKMRVPKRIFKKQRRIKLRVLGTSGIATGEAEWQGELKVSPEDGGRGPVIDLVGIPTKGVGTWTLPSIIRGSVLGVGGATLTRPEIRWYDDRGVEIGRGRTLNLHGLAMGTHGIYASVLDTGDGEATERWLVERTRTGELRVHRGTIKRESEKE